MCFAALIPIAVSALTTAATTAVGSYMQTAAQNQQQAYVYKQQQTMQVANNNAAVAQYDETLARNRQQSIQQANDAFTNNQQQILENQRRQATAVASGATSGITGQPLDQLFNSYQVSMGGIASNLQNTYNNLNTNLFYNNMDAQLQTQSAINRGTPARPYMAQFSMLPSLFAGAAAGASAAFPSAKSASYNPSSGGSGSYGDFLGDPEAAEALA